MLAFIEAILASTLDFAPPVLFAALGGMLSERAGIVALGLEGMMRLSAFFAAVGTLATGNPWLGLCCGMGAAGLAALGHAWLAIRWRSDQIISGVAINLVALAGVTFLVEALYGSTDTTGSATIGKLELGFLSDLPVVRALSNHSWLTWIALLLPVALHALFYATPLGLRILAVGEKPAAAATLGVDVAAIRYGCVVVGGLLAGMGGAALSISTLDRFSNHMPAGQGFIALAAVIFGKWTPFGACGAALFFAAANALRIGLESSVPGVQEFLPSGVLLALPYALTLCLLAGFIGRAQAPAASGIPFDTERR
ncbi:MAG: ABC transporter permease [Myxococcales bacterium]|nr:ABC transporter permease [Myxococcales bacterium]